MSSEQDKAPAAAAAMLNQPIVMDCGTATIKAGFAGGTKPKVRKRDRALGAHNTYTSLDNRLDNCTAANSSIYYF